VTALAVVGTTAESDEDRIRDVIEEAREAGVAADGERLCELLTDAGRRELGAANLPGGYIQGGPGACELAGPQIESVMAWLLPPPSTTTPAEEAAEREVRIDGSEAEASLEVTGITDVMRLEEVDGEWRLDSALSEIDVDDEVVPADEDELRVHVQGMCLAKSEEIGRDALAVVSKPGAGATGTVRAMADSAAAAERPFAARLRELARTEVGRELLAEPLDATRLRVARLESVARRLRHGERVSPRSLDPVDREYNEAFSAAGMELCQTLHGFQS
jgi:hypothetical protein